MFRSKTFIIFLCAFALLCSFYGDSYANSSEAFMSLPFGHMWTRTKLRMERSGAVTIAEKRGESLTMKGMFENREALFSFNFVSKKGLSSKTVNVSSIGNPQDDRALYDVLKMAFENRFGRGQERSMVGAGNSIALRSQWSPDQHTSIVLSYNPNTKRFSDNLAVDSPIRLSYVTSRWSN